MNSRAACAALLLLALFSCAAAEGGKHSDGPPPATQCRFGWVPVTFDPEPWKNLDIRRRPKELNYRCKEACESIGLQPVLTQDADKPKPLCVFQAQRQLGASYLIYGSWYEGEEQHDYESTCRGRDERGQRYLEWATRWNVTSQAFQFGYQCGCSGCVQGCHNAVIPPPSDRATVTNPNGSQSPNSGAFQCKGSLQPWALDTTVMQEVPPGNPALTCPNLLSNTGERPVPPYAYPYPICEGRTAAFGWQWGTRLPDGTCTTYDALVADSPNAFCTANPQTLPRAPVGSPWIPAPRAMSAEEEAASAGRLDVLLGLEVPTIPAERAAAILAKRGNKGNTL